jgi:hypothetical protein
MRFAADDARTTGKYLPGRLSLSGSTLSFAATTQQDHSSSSSQASIAIKLAELLFVSQPKRVLTTSVLSSELIQRLSHGPLQQGASELEGAVSLSSLQVVFAEQKRKKALRKKSKSASDSSNVEFLIPSDGTASVLFANLEAHRLANANAGVVSPTPKKDLGKAAMSLSVSMDQQLDEASIRMMASSPTTRDHPKRANDRPKRR